MLHHLSMSKQAILAAVFVCIVQVVVCQVLKEYFVIDVEVRSVSTTTRWPVVPVRPNVSEEYWIETVLQVYSWIDVNSPEFKQALELRLGHVLATAFQRRQAEYYGQQGAIGQQNNTLMQEFTVQILNITRSGGTNSNEVTVLYVVKRGDSYILARIVVADLGLLSKEEMTGQMGYVVVDNRAYVTPADKEIRNAWIIGAVIGGILALLFCGWFLLCCYFNTCGRDQKLRKTRLKNSVDQPDVVPTPAIVTHKIYLREDGSQTDTSTPTDLKKKHLLPDSITPEPSYPARSTSVASNQPKLSGPAEKYVDLSNGTALKPLDNTSSGRSRSTESTTIKRSFNSSTVSNVQVIGVDQVDNLVNDRESGNYSPLDLRSTVGNLQHLIGHRHSPHTAGDEVTTLFPDLQAAKVSSDIDHPRPRISAYTDDGTLRFHSKEFNVQRRTIADDRRLVGHLMFDAQRHVVYPSNVAQAKPF